MVEQLDGAFVGSPERGRIAVEEVDDVDWPGGVCSFSRESAQVWLAARRHGPTGA